MSDLISRQDAIDAIVNTPTDVYSHDRVISVLDGAAFRQNEIIDIINALPSAEQNILDDGTLTITVPHGMLSKVNRVIVDEVGTKFCKMMYQDALPSAEHHNLNVADYIKDSFPDAWKQAEKELEVPSAEPQNKCDGCFYLDTNGATCEFCARNYPDRFSAKAKGEKND